MNDDFEQQLQRQSPRPLPSDWRADILQAARAATDARSPRRSEAKAGPSSILHHLSSFLWPHPHAWAALATAWLVILALNLSARDASSRTAQRPAPPSPDSLVALRQQERLLAELIGSPEISNAEEPRRSGHAPRSERRDEALNA